MKADINIPYEYERIMKEFERVLCSCKSCRCGYYGKGSIDKFLCDGCKNGIHGGMRPVAKSIKSH